MGEQHPRLDYSHKANITLPRYQIRSKAPHERISMFQRVCKACMSTNRCIKRGLATGKVPLGVIDQNVLLRVRRSTSGCKACGVNLCIYGKCWEAYHSGLKDQLGALDHL